ncbi:hypothetical protein NPIL_406861 [Nephila pilipes]|uniref:Uncharacterized protein n=1 Tax=Nephila pilipes TaxID=299642 RepID=A0A8X6QVH9_NEPPI|nr:hypothetical protein NPIL_406861 [Nephila pilipes]
MYKEIYSKFFESTLSRKPRKESKQHILDTEFIPSTLSTVELELIASPYSVANKLNVSKSHKKSLKDSFLSIVSFKDGGDMHSRITHANVYIICKDSQSISLVEDESF